MTEAFALTAESFDDTVRAGTWIVDFWADWCAPCHAVKPALAEVAASGTVQVATLDVTEHPLVAQRFCVTSLPTLIVFRDGVEVRRLFGTKTARQLLAAALPAS